MRIEPKVSHNNNNSNSNDEIHNSSLSSLAFNDDDLLISPRSPSKRNFLVMRRNSLDSALLPKAPTLLRTVRFEDPERLVKVHLTPPMSEQEVADSFWSEEELQVMLSSASQMAEDAAWKKDRNIVMCIQLCYGLSPDLEVKSKKDYSWLTPEKAINFYYSFKILDETETRTVLRGLEHQISPEIDDYRVQCIQKVLALQSTIQENAHKSSKDRWTWDHLENSLRKQSMELSCRSRRFARLLGKADAAVLGHKVYKGQQKPSKVKRDTTV
mmetsp:Transcript_6418/g.18085  ORF Transcript_6418/g.18085 Transcript_6418/m.18085 type:complete len:270 (-) Transcript_6418:280-1089(-)